MEVDTLTGACLIGRRELVGFSEDYRRGYYEDTDMCLRIKERGYSLVLHRGSVVIHHHGATITAGRGSAAPYHPELMWTDLVHFAAKRGGTPTQASSAAPKQPQKARPPSCTGLGPPSSS